MGIAGFFLVRTMAVIVTVAGIVGRRVRMKELIEDLRACANGHPLDVYMPIMTSAAEALESQAREIAGLKEGQGSLILSRDEQKRLASEYRGLWSKAAVKAQPCGVVLPERLTYSQGVMDYVYGWNDALDEVARLNQPASGGDERAAFEAWYLGHFYMGDKHCGLEWLSTESCGGYRHQHPAEQWIVWQARAALSANHSEQVRVVPVEPTEAMRKAAQDKLAGEGLIVTDWLIHTAYAAMLAAAPSAGSQGGDV